MLRIGHPIGLAMLGTIFVQLLWLVGAVTTAPSTSRAYGSVSERTA
jgi:hypothetical protein